MWCAILFVLAGIAVAGADITGSNPANGACLCVNGNSVNVRSTACGTVIGQANNGACYKYKGTKTTCQLSGVPYDFFSVEYGSGGWIAGTYLNNGAASQCSGIGGAVTCNGPAVEAGVGKCQNHPSAYACGDGTTCQCVAAIFNFCSKGAPTSSWIQGEKVMNYCSSIAKYTAIATFTSGKYDSGHAAVFLSCSANGIQVYDQWCGHPFSARLIRPGGSGYSNDSNNFYVVK